MKNKGIVYLILLLTAVGPLFANGDEDSGSIAIGPDKGIMSASREDGIKLAPEAIKNFELQTKKLAGSSPWEIPAASLLISGEEVNVYRLRSGFYKRIDFETVSKGNGKIKIKSKDLTAGDEIVISGIGFLRAAELMALSGESESHGH